jgi:long-subunit acyl-CoA synthetase (AMP-forming)
MLSLNKINMTKYPTIVDKLYELKTNLPDEIFLRQPYGDIWKEFTYDEIITDALKMVSALILMGLKKGDHIGIYSKNCYQWIRTEIALILGGFVTVPFYASLTGDDLKEVITLSDIKLLFVGKIDNWEKTKAGIPEDLPVIRFATEETGAKVEAGEDWNELTKDMVPDNTGFRPDLDDIWAIFYTSGTTGTPKGAVVTYEAPANLMEGQDAPYNSFNFKSPGKNTFISYMPLNHIAEQTLIVVCSIYNEGQISFVESLFTFAKNLADVKPSVFLAVPNIWTKFQKGIIAKTPKLDALLRIPKVAEQVKKKIRQSLGLDNTKLIISGASAMAPATVEWFQKIGIYIQETYGMTEALGIVILQPRDDIRIGKSGKRLEEGEIRIDPETDEIQVKNNWLFKEYYKDPELTRSVFTDDGFYKTGDTGELDEDDYLRVKGRVKDTFKTAKGKFIVPVPIENFFADNEFIEQICVVGQDLPQPIALVQLSDKVKDLNFDEIKANLQKTLEKVNDKLQLHEKINKLLVMKEKWSLENGFMTPTNKLKRNVINETYKHLYEKWYNDKNRIRMI